MLRPFRFFSRLTQNEYSMRCKIAHAVFVCVLCVSLMPTVLLAKSHRADQSYSAHSEEAAKNTKKSKKSKAKAVATSTKLERVDDLELLSVYTELSKGSINQALAQVDAILHKAPNYRLAHLVKADVLNTKAFRPAPNILAVEQGTFLGNHSLAKRVVELRAEAQLKVFASQYPPAMGLLPKQLLHVDAGIPRVFFADTLRSRLYVYENSEAGLRLGKSYYMVQGKLGANKVKEGDLKTPLGIYFSYGQIDKKLPDLYGRGAMNMDYPNLWDKRNNRTGYGIWLHGSPSDTYSRAPYASDGCVVLSNADLDEVIPMLDPRVPIVLVDDIEFVPREQSKQKLASVQQQFEAWVDALKEANPKELQTFYSSKFTPDTLQTEELQDGRAPLNAWLYRKQVYGKNMGNVLPSVKGLSILAYPKEKDVVHIKFELHYPTSNTKSLKSLPNMLQKTMYWQKEGNDWKIIMETSGVS